MFTKKRTYQVLIAIVGIAYCIYSYTLKFSVSQHTDSYIVFPVSIVLLLIFAFMYIKLDKKGDWKQFFFPLLVYKLVFTLQKPHF